MNIEDLRLSKNLRHLKTADKKWLRNWLMEDMDKNIERVFYLTVHWSSSGVMWREGSGKWVYNLEHVKNLNIDLTNYEEYLYLDCSYTAEVGNYSGLFESSNNSYTMRRTFRIKMNDLVGLLRDEKIKKVLK